MVALTGTGSALRGLVVEAVEYSVTTAARPAGPRRLRRGGDPRRGGTHPRVLARVETRTRRQLDIVHGKQGSMPSDRRPHNGDLPRLLRDRRVRRRGYDRHPLPICCDGGLLSD